MAFADTLEAIDTCPVPVIARVHGAALGGGAGLCAVSDLVDRRGGREVRLHRDAARDPAGGDLAVRDREDRREPGARALPRRAAVRCDPGAADRARARGRGGRRRRSTRRSTQAVADVLASGPTAVRAAKAIVREVRGLGHGSTKWHTARVIARQRVPRRPRRGSARSSRSAGPAGPRTRSDRPDAAIVASPLDGRLPAVVRRHLPRRARRQEPADGPRLRRRASRPCPVLIAITIATAHRPSRARSRSGRPWPWRCRRTSSRSSRVWRSSSSPPGRSAATGSARTTRQKARRDATAVGDRHGRDGVLPRRARRQDDARDDHPRHEPRARSGRGSGRRRAWSPQTRSRSASARSSGRGCRSARSGSAPLSRLSCSG